MGITKGDEAFLRGLRGPRHWTEADARRALSLLEASGGSAAGFARRHGLRATRLAWWKRRLRDWAQEGQGDLPARADDDATPTNGGGFVELVVGSHPGRAAATVRVGDVVVELTALDETAVRFVASLSRALGDESCC